MTFGRYTEMAQRTSREKCVEPLNGVRLSQLENGLMGLCGESGECMDILKKHFFQGHELDREALKDELGDVMWYLAESAEGLGYSLDDIAAANIAKLVKRYPEGFSAERSVNRKEYGAE